MNESNASFTRGLFAGVALDGAVLSIDNGANRSAYGAGVTPRMIFEGRAPQAPSAAIVAFRDTLEELGEGRGVTDAVSGPVVMGVG